MWKVILVMLTIVMNASFAQVKDYEAEAKASMEEANKALDESIAEGIKDYSIIQQLALEYLATLQNSKLSDNEIDRLQKIAEALNKLYPDVGLNLNGMTGNYKKLGIIAENAAYQVKALKELQEQRAKEK